MNHYIVKFIRKNKVFLTWGVTSSDMESALANAKESYKARYGSIDCGVFISKAS